jgi:hypothetical protein
MDAFALADRGSQGQARYKRKQAPDAHDFHDMYAHVSPPTRQSQRYDFYGFIATSPSRPLRLNLLLAKK